MGTTWIRGWPWSRAAVLITGLAMVALACGSNDDETLGSVDRRPDEEPSAAEASESDDETTISSTTTTTTTTIEAPSQPDGSQGSSVTIVRFENDEHLQDTVDIELAREKVIAAVEATDSNWDSCIADPENCDLERDVGPSTQIGGPYYLYLRPVFSRYVEAGARYRLGSADAREVVDVRVSTDVPVQGIVEVCEVDNGEVYVPATGDEPEQVLDDDFAAVIHEYTVIQGADGIFRVGSRSTDRNEGRDETFCDEYR